MGTKLKSHDVAIVGMSHLGLVTALSLASLGKKVVGIDNNNKIVTNLEDKKLPAYEPGLEELLIKYQENISFSSDFSLLKQTKLIFFSQDTATDGSGSVKKLNQLLDQSTPCFKNNTTMICMSQVPIGYYRQANQKIKEKRPGLKFHLYHMVDTIIMTNAIDRFLHPERLIIGKENAKEKPSLQLVSFLKLFDCPVFFMNYESAEITKAAINLYLANTVTYANTLADFCESFGGSIYDIIPALKTDKRIGPFAYLRPTLRIAGGHLERDLLMLKRMAKNSHITSGVAGSIIKENNIRYLWVQNKLLKLLFKNSSHPTISIWGLSYKKNTNSTINAPSLKIIKLLNPKSSLKLYDPMAKLPHKYQTIDRFSDKYEALKGSDCLLILTEWDEFTDVDISSIQKLMKGKIIIDCVGVLHHKSSKLKGFTYIAMGVGTN